MSTLSIVLAGHVDHGKSTVLGRLLAETHTLPEGKLEQIRQTCERNSKPFEYAFLIDALRDEQAQGITIDSARVFFKTKKRHYILIDAPGHIEFLKNMVSGASRAGAALLVIDAKEGVRENSRRHGTMLSLLGIRQVAVLVNKMDLVDFRQDRFEEIRSGYTTFLEELGVTPTGFLPVSGATGENIAARTDRLAWFDGPTVVEQLDAFGEESPPGDRPSRMPVQDIYKFTRFDDDRRIVAGTVNSGGFSAGDEVVFHPSGKESRLRKIESGPDRISAGMAAGCTLEEQIYITRGEIMVRKGEPSPAMSSRVRATIFWLGRVPMDKKKTYLFKLGTAKVPARLEKIERVIDGATLATSGGDSTIGRHAIADVVLKLNRSIAFDEGEALPETSRFVLVDEYEIAGGGNVKEALEDRPAWVGKKVRVRNARWEKSLIVPAKRAEKYNQRATLVLVTGRREAVRKKVAKKLEQDLFRDGRVTYYLAMGNVVYGVDADLRGKEKTGEEHMRRLSEIAHMYLDAGLILIVSAIELTQEDLDIIRTGLGQERITTVWVGDEVTTPLIPDVIVGDGKPAEAAERIKEHLRERGIIFRPW